MNTSYGEGGKENNPPLELFPTLFDDNGAGKVASTVGEGRLSIGNTTSWKVRHVRVHQLGTTYLTEEAVSDNSPCRDSSTDDPEHLTEVGEDMLNIHVTITFVFMANNQRGDGVISWDDHLVLGGVQYWSILQPTSNS